MQKTDINQGRTQNLPVRTSTEDPGKTWALAGILVSVFGFAMIGTALSVVGYVKSKDAGRKNTLAIWGVIVGSILSIIGTIALIVFGSLFVDMFGGIIQKCNELGPGSHTVDGVTYTCESSAGSKIRI